jgi:hypothetical protein
MRQLKLQVQMTVDGFISDISHVYLQKKYLMLPL